MITRHKFSSISVVCLCLFVLSGAGLAATQESDGLEGLRLGIQLVEEGNDAAAIETLEASAIQVEAEQAAPSVIEPEPGAAPDSEFTAALTITTQPTGATVYVAGHPGGETPVEISGLRPGNHRVTIVRDGYVNNSRIVALAANQNELLDITLTPGTRGSVAAESQEDAAEDAAEGGGGWWKWAALAGGGGAAAYLLLPQNQPPVAGLRIMPSGMGMADATQYRFDGGTSSDPDDDPLTYSWNFGDGSNGSGLNATHVYDSAGTYTVTLTVSDGKESATTTGSAVVARNLDGGSFVSQTLVITSLGVRFNETIRLTQTGTSLRGTSRSDGNITGTINVSGAVTSSQNFVCPCDVRLTGSGGYRFSGTVDNGANILRGDLTFNLGGRRWTWRGVTFRR